MNINLLDEPIYSTPYISHVPLTSPTTDQFHIDTWCSIYVVAIDNKDHILAATAIQLLRDKQKRARYFSVKITLDRLRPCDITPLKEHRTFFGQGCTILAPAIHHHEVLFTITLVEPSNFIQVLKGPGQVNWIKGAFEKYYKTALLVS